MLNRIFKLILMLFGAAYASLCAHNAHATTTAPNSLLKESIRDYEPKFARYIQADPIRLQAGPNMYAYVNNDPINSADPTGLDAYTFARYGSAIPTPGFEISIGTNPNDTAFFQFNFGWGIGGGWKYNPLGIQAGYDKKQTTDCLVGAVGLFGKLGKTPTNNFVKHIPDFLREFREVLLHSTLSGSAAITSNYNTCTCNSDVDAKLFSETGAFRGRPSSNWVSGSVGGLFSISGGDVVHGAYQTVHTITHSDYGADIAELLDKAPEPPLPLGMTPLDMLLTSHSLYYMLMQQAVNPQ